MKNVIKKCKNEVWKAWVVGAILGILIFGILNFFKANNYIAGYIVCIILSCSSFIGFYTLTQRIIWSKAFQKKYDIQSKREINHLLLIQKTINSCYQDKSKDLINKYRNSKYCIMSNFILFKGIYIGKFSTEDINVINN